MDTPTFITGAVLTALCFGPFLYFVLKGRKDRVDRLAYFNEIATEHNLVIAHFQTFGRKVIGLDTGRMVLLVTRVDSTGEHFTLNDLRNVTRCRPLETKQTSQQNGSAYITAVHLELEQRHGQGVTVELFSLEHDIDLSDEQHIARKWAMIINASIRDRSVQIKKTLQDIEQSLGNSKEVIPA